MESKARIDIALLLPEVPDARDECVYKLERLLASRPGIERAHVVGGDGRSGALCLHFDPDVVPLAQVERMARTAFQPETNFLDYLDFQAKNAIENKNMDQFPTRIKLDELLVVAKLFE